MELDGKPLSFWLQELVAPESDRRVAAASLLNRFDDEFDHAVFHAIGQSGFPRREWLAQLVDFLYWADQTRMSLYCKEQKRSDRVWEKLQERYPTSEAMKAAPNQLCRWIMSSCDPKNSDQKEQALLLEQQLAAQLVLNAVGAHVLEVPMRLSQMLDDKKWSRKAGDLLYKLGPRAADLFADELWRRWNIEPFFGDYVLASVISESPAYIRKVGDCLHPPFTHERRRKAANVLCLIGSQSLTAVPESIPLFLDWLGDPALQTSGAEGLGTFTVGQEIAVEPLLALSYSDDVWAKKSALVALGKIGMCPERVVPRLIAAFEDYSEPDSDYLWGSDHFVVADALKSFGSAAAEAVPALASRIKTSCGETDRGVVLCLIAMGIAAWPALEALESYMEQDVFEGLDAPDDEIYLVESAVWRLRHDFWD